MENVGEQCGRFVLHELLTTEQQYLDDLRDGIERYGKIFEEQTTLPAGLVGKQQILLGNVIQIAAVHQREVLPLMLRHSQHLEPLFEHWCELVERGVFYCYVLFIASQRASLKLYDSHEVYFKRLQIKLCDPLGIRSFLLKPVQRITKYPLLLSKFIQTFYNNRSAVSKRLFEVACRLETRLRELLDTANQSDLLNDIKHFNAFNILREAIFLMVAEFTVHDIALRRCYNGKLFIFNTCIIYTEVKATKLLFRGSFLLPDVAIDANVKSLVLCNKQLEVEFVANPSQVHKCAALVRHLLQRHAMSDTTRNTGTSVLDMADALLNADATSSRTVWYTEH